MDAKKRQYTVRFAQSDEDIISAQRLRYRVFVEELGARAEGCFSDEKREVDKFDDAVLHLCLIDNAAEAAGSLDKVVGVYRLIPEDIATRIGGFYSESEFDLGAMRRYNGKKLELGRSCIDKAHRGGTGVAELWAALGQYIAANDFEYVFGAASFHGTDRKKFEPVLQYLFRRFGAGADYAIHAKGENVIPYRADYILPAASAELMRDVPALIKAYLRLGGKIGYGAFIDNDFNTIDVFLLMKADAMVERYRRVYLEAS